MHNGGAIAISCRHLDSISYVDGNTTSDVSIVNTIIESDTSFYNSSHVQLESKLNGRLFLVEKHRMTIRDNQFEENFSGGKGTAIYINQISLTNIVGNTFYRNGPVYATAELLNSPYVKQY